jgi:hypothetical protein
MIHNVNNTIFLRLLHWGDVCWLGLLVVGVGLGHLPAERQFLLGRHLLVCQLNVPLLLHLEPIIQGIANIACQTFGFCKTLIREGVC